METRNARAPRRTMGYARKYTGYSADVLRAAADRGELKVERPGNRLYFTDEWLDAWLALIAEDSP